MSTAGFQPDWLSAPGDTIAEALRERDLSNQDFAHALSLSNEEFENLVAGRQTITIGLARRLSTVIGASVEFWMSRDFQYRQDAKRLEGTGAGWLKQLPIGDMIKFGWITPPPLPSGEVEACLQFFDVSSIDEWRDKYDRLPQLAVYRSSPSFESRHGAVAAWLRQGELDAMEIECEPWDSEAFEQKLMAIRPLTRQKYPDRFVPALQEACSTVGVAVVIVRSPTGCRASGATRFLNDNKAVLQLSVRYLADDQFWFTFFHEAGHLVRHRERMLFSATLAGGAPLILEGPDTPEDELEEEANRFAAEMLIPRDYQTSLSQLRLNRQDVLRFAHRVGIAPGIVVGQLQHTGRLRYDQLNGLKRRYEWEN